MEFYSGSCETGMTGTLINGILLGVVYNWNDWNIN